MLVNMIQSARQLVTSMSREQVAIVAGVATIIFMRKAALPLGLAAAAYIYFTWDQKFKWIRLDK